MLPCPAPCKKYSTTQGLHHVLSVDGGIGRLLERHISAASSRWPVAQVAEKLSVPFHEVDAHNVVPCWEASDKREYGARTIRPKIHRQLPEFLQVLHALLFSLGPCKACHQTKPNATQNSSLCTSRESPL